MQNGRQVINSLDTNSRLNTIWNLAKDLDLPEF